MSFPYEDIISLPHPVSCRHARMTDADRAAQFSPFAALNGHSAAIDETARLTDCQAELAPDEQEILNKQLLKLAARLSERPVVSVTCFVPDERKPGGAYTVLTGVVKKIDAVEQALIWEDGRRTDLKNVYGVAGYANF